ncbi:adenylate kinase [Paenarthrobacter nitroguajacolicus]|uniref:adenylate kinase n=1 Tax=Paenarthrobacter nitroguajacolicus TaxID=211146 RepID=UPI00248B1491|nr:adenylate kinase [Paenarthrobacter nitroguajacolicus]MDI2036280.1 adenylate kinase [Paenarthrobacter nitroguajacolicus]
MRLLIIGAPGSGKGTQAALISEKLGVPAISTGDIFRENVRNLTQLGQEAKNFMDSGDFVPDAITNEMVRDRLHERDAEQGFLLDGYPRTVAQADYLDGILSAEKPGISAVLQLVVPDGELVSRLLARAVESGRTDDTEQVIKHRLELYHRQTEPVVSRYSERGILARANGTGSISDVLERALHAITAASSGTPSMV